MRSLDRDIFPATCFSYCSAELSVRIVAPRKLMLLIKKTSTFILKASLLGKIFVLRTSNFRGATISR